MAVAVWVLEASAGGLSVSETEPEERCEAVVSLRAGAKRSQETRSHREAARR